MKDLLTEDLLVTLERLQPLVRVWSDENFGNQGYINPLLGIGEEIGEYFEAHRFEDRNDALADIMIFMMDFANRYEFNLGATIRILLSRTVQIDPSGLMPIAYGRMCQGVLKKRQGIRSERWENLVLGVFSLTCCCAARAQQMPLSDVINQTWNEIVSKREWSANKEEQIGAAK